MARNDNAYHDRQVAGAYDARHRGTAVTTTDIPFYVELAMEAAAAEQSVLELGCGTGRVTLPIARAGVRITGLDNSPAMLDVARRKAVDEENPRWTEADMTSFALGERFGLVLIPFRSFLLLLSEAEQEACLQRVHEHLEAGGRLALNIVNPTKLLPVGATLRQRREGIISRAERGLRVRYVFPEEMERLLLRNGFEVEGLYGWFDRETFSDDSDEQVWLARRRET